MVMSNIWHNHNDPSVWKEPELFRPERFLDEEGKFRPREELTPFGIGKSEPNALSHSVFGQAVRRHQGLVFITASQYPTRIWYDSLAGH